MQPRTLGWPDYVALVLYFAANLVIGLRCARRKQSTDDYFRGGGRVPWWASGVSFFATSTSSISFMALPARAFMSNWVTFGTAFAQTAGTLGLAFVFVGLLRRLNMTTVFEYLELRFGRSVRQVGGVLAMLLAVFGRVSVVMLLPSLALSAVTGLNVYASILVMGIVTTIYAMEGGFEAVIWTDVMQVVVTFSCVALAIVFIAKGVPHGFAGIIADGTAAGKFHLADHALNFNRPTTIVFVGMGLGSLFTQLADQALMQRVFSTPDVRSARRTILLGAAMGLPSSVVFFFVGTALYVFYQYHPGRIPASLPNDSIFPYFIANELPTGIVGLVVAAVFAAAMGTISSCINSVATIVLRDFVRPVRPDLGEQASVRLARWVTLVAGTLGTLMALYIASLNVSSLWDEFVKLLALIGGGFPGVFALGLLSRRANAPGVLVGAFASIVITWWVQTFTTVNVFLHSFIAIGSCMVIGYLASLVLSRRSPSRPLAGLTVWTPHATGKVRPTPQIIPLS